MTLFIAIMWFCGAIFIGIGIFSFKKKEPMHFWAGTTVKSNEITNIKTYNRANGIMWTIYGSIFILSGIFALFNMGLATIVLTIAGIGGTFLLVVVYNFIYNKYKA